MLAKYSIEYSLAFRRHSPPQHQIYYTDDPVACEEFVHDLLERGMGIHAIRHDGVDLPQPEFDQIVKIATNALAARHVCTSLGLKAEEERYRFGFSV